MILRPLLLTAVLLSVAFEARADDKTEAQALFTEGLKLAETGDSAGALKAFRSAYDKSPNYRVLYNIGQLCSRAADAVCAVRAYERYLREGASAIPQKRRETLESDIQSLKRTLGTLTIAVSVEGAWISVDDEKIGQAPLPGSVAVAVGAHKVTVVFPNATVERSTTITIGGESATLEIAPPPPPPPVEEPSAKPEPSPPPPPKPFPIIPWAVTGGFAALTLVSGVATGITYAAYQDKRETFPVTRQELSDSQGTARTLFIVTGVLGACTIASAAVSAYLTWMPKPKSSITVGLLPMGAVIGGAL